MDGLCAGLSTTHVPEGTQAQFANATAGHLQNVPVEGSMRFYIMFTGNLLRIANKENKTNDLHQVLLERRKQYQQSSFVEHTPGIRQRSQRTHGQPKDARAASGNHVVVR